MGREASGQAHGPRLASRHTPQQGFQRRRIGVGTQLDNLGRSVLVTQLVGAGFSCDCFHAHVVRNEPETSNAIWVQCQVGIHAHPA